MSYDTKIAVAQAKADWASGVGPDHVIERVMKMHPADQLDFIRSAARTEDADTVILVRSLMRSAYTVGRWDVIDAVKAGSEYTE